jgi:riboflavin kinase/FMN adenylyltransferase
MRVVGYDEAAGECEGIKGASVTIGVFDGLHAGHRALIERCVRRAGAGPSVVFTFRNNPKKLLKPDAFPGDLVSLDRKLELLEAFGVDLVVLIDFSGDFSRMPGRIFLSTLHESVHPDFVAIGSDFHCGKGRDTDAAELRSFFGERGVTVEIFAPVVAGGEVVSSTRIRLALQSGNIGAASELLGREVEVELGGHLGLRDGVHHFARPEGLVLPPPGLYPVTTDDPESSGQGGIMVKGNGLELVGLGGCEGLARVRIM